MAQMRYIDAAVEARARNDRGTDAAEPRRSPATGAADPTQTRRPGQNRKLIKIIKCQDKLTNQKNNKSGFVEIERNLM